MKWHHALALSCLAFSLNTPVAQAADLVDASNPEMIRNIASGFGSAKLDTDNSGDPMVIGRIAGTRYSVYFYGCKNNTNCTDLLMRASWNSSNPANSMEHMNRWNQKKRYGKAFLDKDGDPTIELVVNLRYGVSYNNIEDTFDWWEKAIKDFEEYLH